MNKIGNVSMPQLMGCYLKVQVVNHFSVMSGLLSQDRCDSMLYSFSIFIPVIAPFLDRPRNNILPKSLKLRVGQRLSLIHISVAPAPPHWARGSYSPRALSSTPTTTYPVRMRAGVS